VSEQCNQGCWPGFLPSQGSLVKWAANSGSKTDIEKNTTGMLFFVFFFSVMALLLGGTD